jgi:hypothetical protein
MLNRLALCSLMRGLVLRTAQSAQLSARQLRAKQSPNRASCRSSLHHDPALSKIRRVERVPMKNVGEAILSGNDLREHEPAVPHLLNYTNSTLAYAYLSISSLAWIVTAMASLTQLRIRRDARIGQFSRPQLPRSSPPGRDIKQDLRVGFNQ